TYPKTGKQGKSKRKSSKKVKLARTVSNQLNTEASWTVPPAAQPQSLEPAVVSAPALPPKLAFSGPAANDTLAADHVSPILAAGPQMTKARTLLCPPQSPEAPPSPRTASRLAFSSLWQNGLDATKDGYSLFQSGMDISVKHRVRDSDDAIFALKSQQSFSLFAK
ncbi:hypothetical protein HDU91_003823, partial [Kappamyces sp. JEL0680]